MTAAAVFEFDVPWVFTERGREPAVDETWTVGAELMVIDARSVGGYNIAAEHVDVRIELDELEANGLR